MRPFTRARPPGPLAAWFGAWLLLVGLLALWLLQQTLVQRQDAFDTDARIAHRLLSQRAVQHDAVLATLTLLQPGAEDGNRGDPVAAVQRLPALYPQILRVASHSAHTAWPAGPWGDALETARAASQSQGRPVLAWFDATQGRFWMVLAATPASYALQIDARAMVPWAEWPIGRDSPVRTALSLQDQRLLLQPGVAAPSPWQFDFRKRLATDSQPFDVTLHLSLPWSALPWGQLALGALLLAGLLGGAATWRRQRRERLRAEELLRLGQVARLNALGELAAGMAHELNQPLTALLANTQAASRLLQDDPPELETARAAMGQAVQQARRASEVVTRLRRSVERPDLAAVRQHVRLDELARNALYLLEPQCRQAQVQTAFDCAAPVQLLGDAVALEQVLHNLLMNALQALEKTPPAQRRLSLVVEGDQEHARVRVRDSGPGIAPAALPHLFEPFFSTREGGLGLGLSLCESLVQGMGGTLRAANLQPHGAEFVLGLPLADAVEAAGALGAKGPA